MVSCDMRTRSKGGGEDERVEFSIPSLDLFRLLLSFWDWGVLGEESENPEFCFDVRVGHGEDGKDKKEGGKEGGARGGNKAKLVIFVACKAVADPVDCDAGMTDKRAGIMDEPLESYDRFRSTFHPRNIHGEMLATWAPISELASPKRNFRQE